MKGPSIREANTDDVEPMVRVINDAYAVEKFFIKGERTYVEELRRFMETATLFVATADGNIVGTVLLRDEGAEGYFGLLAVSPALQNKGIGTVLVRHAEDHFRQQGCGGVRLVVPHLRTELFPWYRSLGYEERRTLPFPEPEKLKRPCHMVEMAKRISEMI
jgi:predicted N-acetyltransferase YhbS